MKKVRKIEYSHGAQTTALARNAYDEQGGVVSVIDSSGSVTIFENSGQGQFIRKILNPATGNEKTLCHGRLLTGKNSSTDHTATFCDGIVQ